MRERGYGSALRARWRWIVLCAAVGLGLEGVACALTPLSYEASAQLYVAARGGGDSSDLFSGTQFAQQQAQSYARLATSQLVLMPVITQLGLSTTPSALAGQITASAEADSVIIGIQVGAGTAVDAARIANAVSGQLSRAAAQLQTMSGTPGDAVSVTVVQSASVPSSAASPDVPVDLALGLLAGIVAGLYVAVVRDRLDSRVYSAADVAEVTDAPVIGEIEAAVDLDQGLVVSGGVGAESFRRLRTNIRSLGDDPSEGAGPGQQVGRSVFVTSAVPGEGKTTTASNLALAMAETGRSVALVEADLRRPRMPATAGLAHETGLTDVLLGATDLDSALHQWGDSGVQVLISGQVTANPGELLSSAAMARLLADLAERFDEVVIDSPPVLPFADSLVLAGLARGTIVVVASGRVRRRQVERSLNALRAANVPVVGVVLNFVPPTHERRGAGQPFGRSAAPSGTAPWRGWRAMTELVTAGGARRTAGGESPDAGTWETYLPDEDVREVPPRGGWPQTYWSDGPDEPGAGPDPGAGSHR